ncbi:MAG TPA: sterol desaturase family protein [Steroidobacteraceae bacterium]|nr:sterol desaturase family protein [Steroidobacteraceae bacterium]
MGKLRLILWWLAFLFACGLVVSVSGHGRIQAFVEAHPGLAAYLLLAVLLAIPARVVALVAAYLIELLFVGWSRSSLRMLWKPRASVRLDILSTVVLMLPQQYLRYLGYLLSFGLLFATDAYVGRHLDVSLNHWLPLWGLQLIAFTVFQSLLRYWLHRLEHAVPALWAVHKFHHSADRMNILTAGRDTQFVKGVEQGLVVLPMGLLVSPTLPHAIALGSPGFIAAAVYFVYHSFIIMNSYMAHSNLRTDYGWVGRWLIVSPRMHRLHHAVPCEFHDKNFSNDLVIWDRLFGTYARCDTPAGDAGLPVGIEDNPFNRSDSFAGSLREYFFTTYLELFRELKKGLTALLPTGLRAT